MFITTYERYPIYEPAEGGYYYSGNQMVESRSFSCHRKAKQYINKLYRQAIKEGEKESKYWYQSKDNLSFGVGSKYIGEGWFVRLERKQGQEERGYTPYC